MRYKWGIPSYKRSDAPLTVNLLHKLGYSKEDIIVSTQTAEDYKAYSEKQGDIATVIYREGTNDSINRNTVLNYLSNESVLLLADDDITAFERLSADGKELIPFTDGDELERYFDLMFRYCVRHNSKLWAWYTVENAFFMKHTIDDKNILNGTILGIVNDSDVRFDETFDLKGDYEISLRFMSRGMNAIRFNGFVCKAKAYSKGGCEDARKAGNNDGRFKELLRRYPTLIKPSHRCGEIKFIGKVNHSSEKELWNK